MRYQEACSTFLCRNNLPCTVYDSISLFCCRNSCWWHGSWENPPNNCSDNDQLQGWKASGCASPRENTTVQDITNATESSSQSLDKHSTLIWNDSFKENKLIAFSAYTAILSSIEKMHHTNTPYFWYLYMKILWKQNFWWGF